jgi:hypothetical protein
MTVVTKPTTGVSIHLMTITVLMTAFSAMEMNSAIRRTTVLLPVIPVLMARPVTKTMVPAFSDRCVVMVLKIKERTVMMAMLKMVTAAVPSVRSNQREVHVPTISTATEMRLVMEMAPARQEHRLTAVMGLTVPLIPVTRSKRFV